ncbi:MAG: metal-sensitive transcriptional regulator [Candidatus Falkowbacteria bacterium]
MPKIERTPEQLLNIVIGQLEGVKKMLAGEKDCLKVLVQLKAAKSALNNATTHILSQNMHHCLVSTKPKDRKQLDVLLAELTKM